MDTMLLDEQFAEIDRLASLGEERFWESESIVVDIARSRSFITILNGYARHITLDGLTRSSMNASRKYIKLRASENTNLTLIRHADRTRHLY